MPHNRTNNFPLKNYLFGTVKLTRNPDRSKFNYNGQDIVFDGEGSWIFDNYFARSVVVFGVDNRSPSQYW